MLSVACIPAFNAENQINDVIKKSLNYVDKVLVCDDGSTDNTFENAKLTGAYVLKHEKNLGKGAALKTLFTKAKELNADIIITIDADGQFLPVEMVLFGKAKELNADVIITIDADGQFLPVEMIKLIEPIQNNNFDLVIGNRFLDKKEMPSYRKAGNKILDSFTKLAADLPFEDTQSGFRSYSKTALEKISFSSNGFGVDSEILIDAVNKNLKITEKYVTVIYNTGEKTSTKNPISHSVGVLASIIELIAINHPLRYLGIPGLIFLVIGIAYSIIAITLFNDTRYFSIPSTLLALGSLVIGLMLLLMSVVLYSISHQSRRNI